MSRYCSKCGREFPDHLKFCALCGNSLLEIPVNNVTPNVMPAGGSPAAGCVESSSRCCPGCGNIAIDHVKYCIYCGLELPPAPAEPLYCVAGDTVAQAAEVRERYCDVCGKPIPAEHSFCSSCGRKIG